MTLDIAAVQVVILVGAFCGNFVATMLPYWNKKRELGELGVEIFFDNKFLGTAAIAAISSFVLIGGSFTSVVNQVTANGEITLVAAFFSAAGIGYGLNRGLNTLVTANVEQKAEAEEVIRQRIIAQYEEDKLLDKAKSLDEGGGRVTHIPH